MFVNMSNHPSADWSPEQVAAAEVYGRILDFPFPDVPSQWTALQVEAFAGELSEKIRELHPSAVLCQGEMTLTYQLVKRMLAAGIPVLCACTDRQAVETVLPDGTTKKVSHFVFKGFRPYESLPDGKG